MSSPYDPAAVRSAVAVVRNLAGEDAAAAFETVLSLRRRGSGHAVCDPATFGAAAGFGDTPGAVWDRIDAISYALYLGFDIRFTAQDEANVYRRSAKHRRTEFLSEEDAALVRPSEVALSGSLCSILDDPYPAPSPTDLPVPDATSAAWIATVQAAARSGRGHHLMLRHSAAEGGREGADFAGLVAAGGVRVDLVANTPKFNLAAAILRAELHAGATGHVVVVDADAIMRASNSFGDSDDDGILAGSAADLRSGAEFALPWLRDLRNVYVWRAPAADALPRELDGIAGGCIGPIGFARSWSESVVAAAAPGIGPKGTASLLAQVRDPRDTGAMAAMAAAAVSAGEDDLDEACAFVARSFGGRSGGLAPAPPPPPALDPRLVVSDHDIGLLLDRAGTLARNGGRVLFWGPPGGGKTSCAQLLARRMAGRPAIMVTPATILAYRWGAMERRLTALWTKVAVEGATLVIDELDSLCGARDSGGNNNYLIRCLTDEFLRHFDHNPSVPVLATVNDPMAVDDAIRRRFHMVIEIRDALTPDRELLAWRIILGVEPPDGWTPVGASVADFSSAKQKCLMLGLTGSQALAGAVLQARDARTGPGRSRPGATKGESVH